MKLAVLNAGGGDPFQAFPEGAGSPDERVHAPINFHAYAACTRGSFCQRVGEVPPEADAILLLLRRDMKGARRAIKQLRAAGGRPIWISLKECGGAQVAAALGDRERLSIFQELCSGADGALAATEELQSFYQGAGAERVEFLPTPYPVEEPAWDFSQPEQERRGIFVGTREFKTASRHHLAALLALKPLAESTGEPVTVINGEGRRGRRLLAQLRYPAEALQVIEGTLPYPSYLRAIARHKLVFQLDGSFVPGQVAGDALLARTLCIGGNGTVEGLAFRESCGHGRGTPELLALAGRWLAQAGERAVLVESALRNSRAALSFAACAQRLEMLLAGGRV